MIPFLDFRMRGGCTRGGTSTRFSWSSSVRSWSMHWLYIQLSGLETKGGGGWVQGQNGDLWESATWSLTTAKSALRGPDSISSECFVITRLGLWQQVNPEKACMWMLQPERAKSKGENWEAGSHKQVPYKIRRPVSGRSRNLASHPWSRAAPQLLSSIGEASSRRPSQIRYRRPNLALRFYVWHRSCTCSHSSSTSLAINLGLINKTEFDTRADGYLGHSFWCEISFHPTTQNTD